MENKNISEGLDFILAHLKEPLWPKTISTKTTGGRQILVHNKQETLARYKAANFIDCRICAYPYYAKYIMNPRYLIDLVMIDLDISNFKSRQALDRALAKTVRNIKDILGGFESSVLWSGNGYHIYIPIESRYTLEERPEFNRFREPSKQFLRFAEWYLSYGKCDLTHNNTISFSNCMLRIPGSHNSKCVQLNKGIGDTSTQVKIINQWNKKRAHIYFLIGSFLAYLIDQKEKEAKRNYNYANSRKSSNTTNNILWIETLLQTPLMDYRKYCIWRILTPYLINVRQLPYQESFNKINEWLDKCNRLHELDFNAK